jgi:hypothetical protein
VNLLKRRRKVVDLVDNNWESKTVGDGEKLFGDERKKLLLVVRSFIIFIFIFICNTL